VLGKHEIATVQTTSIEDTGLIRLTTILAHSSGEWIASDWPVCAASETVAPQRMGAALTYARRYALFTLVGIAGEDDLDAPDLTHKGQTTALASAPGPAPGNEPASQNATAGSQRSARRPVLSRDESSALCDRLLAEISALTSAADLLTWARARLPAKNTLTAADAKMVEAAFRSKQNALPVDQDSMTEPACPLSRPSDGAGKLVQTDKANVANDGLGSAPKTDHVIRTVAPKPLRIRDKNHRDLVASRPCIVCGRQPSDAHHLRFAQPRATGRKVSDEFTVPLCRVHHRRLHDTGNETEWWEKMHIDPIPIAQSLWRESRAKQLGTTTAQIDERKSEHII
jgi:hypothetical protein